MRAWKMMFLFKRMILRFHVNSRGLFCLIGRKEKRFGNQTKMACEERKMFPKHFLWSWTKGAWDMDMFSNLWMPCDVASSEKCEVLLEIQWDFQTFRHSDIGCFEIGSFKKGVRTSQDNTNQQGVFFTANLCVHCCSLFYLIFIHLYTCKLKTG